MPDFQHLTKGHTNVQRSTKAIFISRFVPDPVGHGGNHRAYQVQYDLARIVGEENVLCISWPEWSNLAAQSPVQSVPPARQRLSKTVRRIGHRIPPLLWAVRLWRKNGIRTWLRSAQQRLRLFTVKHPVDLLLGQGMTSQRYDVPQFLAYYQSQVVELQGQAFCIIEHPGFAALLPINQQLNIPTLACVQNVEAFDTPIPFSRAQPRARGLVALDFVDEFSVWAQCDARLFISKVDAGLAGGLGLSSYYYPYLPVGKIRENLLRIRQQRAESAQEQGLFLLIGSAGHQPTGEGFAWFVQQVQHHGLPASMRVIVAGGGADKLLPAGSEIPGLECRGWLPQEEFDQLLVMAQAVLIPQFRGFGALTRLPEMACAGIPTLVSCHPTLAIDLPPGIQVVEDTWEVWKQALLNIMHSDVQKDICAYADWEGRQPQILHLWMEQLLHADTGETKASLSSPD